MTPVAILKDLISIPSVNPMGRDLSGAYCLESRLSDYLTGFFRELGVAYEQIELAGGRSNVLARFDPPAAHRTIVLDAHQDTVPTDGMIIDPFQPAIEDGRIFGRGACDVKGGMAAMLAAFARLVQDGDGPASVVMSCTCDEEATLLGITDLVKLWTDPARQGSLLSKRPDVAVVAEPTGLDVVVAHRGATRWKLHTTGRACHSSEPSQGTNAIYRMARVLDCLEQYAQSLPTSVPPHPLCGSPTLSVGRIEGGSSVNVVPAECSIEIDRRVIPGEDGRKVIRDVHEFLRSRLDFEVEMGEPWIVGCPLPDDDNHGWADRLLEHVARVSGPHQKVGVFYGTHASRMAAAGVPAVVFGPGSIAQAHTKDEWLSLEELEQASEIYYRFCKDGT